MMSENINLLIGIPGNNNDYELMVNSFINSKGYHIICGGRTAYCFAKYVNKEITIPLVYEDNDIPPIGIMDGIDLVTEGVITLSKVLHYLQESPKQKNNKDGASLIYNYLIESNSMINFFIGKSINIFHQNELPNDFTNKLLIIDQIICNLKKLNKQLNIKYF